MNHALVQQTFNEFFNGFVGNYKALVAQMNNAEQSVLQDMFVQDDRWLREQAQMKACGYKVSASKYLFG